jgi:hypothetical protein
VPWGQAGEPGPKFNYKLAWFERLIAHAAELMTSSAPVVLASDYNVVPTPQDIYPTRSLDNNALIQPARRQALAFAGSRLDRRNAGATSGRDPLDIGITNMNGGRRTKACDSITFCSRRRCQIGFWTVV